MCSPFYVEINKFYDLLCKQNNNPYWTDKKLQDKDGKIKGKSRLT
jgi:hypothetical protein